MARVLVFCLCAVGCATNGSSSLEASATSGGDSPPGASADSGVVCQRETMPGSHIRRRVCRSEEGREVDRASAKRAIENRAPGYANDPNAP